VNAAILAKSGSVIGEKRFWKSSLDVWSLELFSGLLSFVLSWTLSFALVHGMLF
jgi:hypothetical protein